MFGDQFIQGENARRQESANRYNAYIGNFNAGLSAFGSQVNPLSSTINGLSLGNFTPQQLGGYRTDINSLRNSIASYQGPDTFSYRTQRPQATGAQGGNQPAVGIGPFGRVGVENNNATDGLSFTGDIGDLGLGGVFSGELDGGGILGGLAGSAIGGPIGGFIGGQLGSRISDNDSVSFGDAFGAARGFVNDTFGTSFGQDDTESSDSGEPSDPGGFSFSAAPTRGRASFAASRRDGSSTGPGAVARPVDPNLISLQLNRPARPQFPATLSQGGQVQSFNVPSLLDPNEGLRTNYLSTLDGLLGRVDTLGSDYNTAAGQVRDFRSGALGDVSQLGAQLTGLGIQDRNGLNSAQSAFAALQGRVAGFDNPVASQLYPDGFTQLNTQLGNVGNTLTGLLDERGNEQSRIDAFRSQARTDAAGLGTEVAGLDLANVNEDVLRDLRSRLASERGELVGFTSPLAPTFERSANALNDVATSVSDLTSRYGSARSDLSSTRNTIQSNVDAIQSGLRGATPRDINDLDALGRDIRNVRQSVADFSNPLDYDFSSTLEPLGGFESQLSGLRDQRSQALSGFADTLAPLSEGIGDIPLTESDALNERLTALRSLQSDASPYGNSNVGTEIGAALDTVEGRIGELEAKQRDIEGNAQGLFGEIDGNYFASLDTVNGLRERLATIRANADSYGAEQAADEIEQIATALDTEVARLGADRDAYNQRYSQASDRIRGQLGSSGELTLAAQLAGMTPEEYAALVASGRDDELQAAANSSPFARALGV